MPRPLPCLPALLLAACAGPDPLIGDWEADSGSSTWVQELHIDEALGGTASLHYTLFDLVYHSSYDVEAQNRGGGLYWIDLDCVEDCPEAQPDFRLTCDLEEGADRMDCEAPGWSTFTWERTG